MSQISIMLYTMGKMVEYNGALHEVEYVTLSGMCLYIRLVGIRELVLASDVWCEPTVMKYWEFAIDAIATAATMAKRNNCVYMVVCLQGFY